jgi:hypothetical protein
VAGPFRHEYSLNSDNSGPPLPNSVDGVNSPCVAISLCFTMGDRSSDENACGTIFDQTVGEFFPVVNGTPHVDGQVGRGFHADSSCVKVRMDKIKMSQGGDPYTQIARAYDLPCEWMEIAISPRTLQSSFIRYG